MLFQLQAQFESDTENIFVLRDDGSSVFPYPVRNLTENNCSVGSEVQEELLLDFSLIQVIAGDVVSFV